MYLYSKYENNVVIAVRINNYINAHYYDFVT